MLADTLTYEELKDRHLQREVEVLRETRKYNAWATLAHGNSKTNQIIEYDYLWPKMIFEQGNKNSCLQRSMCSVLMYIRKSRYVKDEFLNKIIDDLNRSRIYNEQKYKKGKINIVLQYMRSKGFQMKKFESKKKM